MGKDGSGAGQVVVFQSHREIYRAIKRQRSAAPSGAVGAVASSALPICFTSPACALLANASLVCGWAENVPNAILDQPAQAHLDDLAISVTQGFRVAA